VLGSVTLSMPQSRAPSEKDRHHLFQLVRECASLIRRNLAAHAVQHHFAVPDATRK
jgi:DNA-binding IclR family transcriptional regulator